MLVIVPWSWPMAVTVQKPTMSAEEARNYTEEVGRRAAAAAYCLFCFEEWRESGWWCFECADIDDDDHSALWMSLSEPGEPCDRTPPNYSR